MTEDITIHDIGSRELRLVSATITEPQTRADYPHATGHIVEIEERHARLRDILSLLFDACLPEVTLEIILGHLNTNHFSSAIPIISSPIVYTRELN